MEKIGIRSTEKTKESEIAAKFLKSLVSRGLLSPVQPMSVKAKGREIFSTTAPLAWGGWDVLYGGVIESEAEGGLKFIDELDLSEVKRQVDDLNSQVESVLSELHACREGISTLLNELKEKPVIKQTELLDLDEALEVIRPIPVVIEEYADEVIASFPEIEAFGAGLCEAEAIIDLKNEIKKTFFELEEVSDEELGKLPLSWKRVLSKVVKKIGNSQ